MPHLKESACMPAFQIFLESVSLEYVSPCRSPFAPCRRLFSRCFLVVFEVIDIQIFAAPTTFQVEQFSMKTACFRLTLNFEILLITSYKADYDITKKHRGDDECHAGAAIAHTTSEGADEMPVLSAPFQLTGFKKALNEPQRHRIAGISAVVVRRGGVENPAQVA